MPKALYESTSGSLLTAPQPLHKRLAGSSKDRTLMGQFVVPARSGKAWPVKAGQIRPVVAVDGPQVVDFNAWNLHNPRSGFERREPKQLHHALSTLTCGSTKAQDHQQHQDNEDNENLRR